MRLFPIPQTAACLSTRLKDWGSGNTFTNTLSRRSLIRGDVQYPSGAYKILTSGQYIVSSLGSPKVGAGDGVYFYQDVC